MPALILAQVEPTYIMSRNIFIREDSSKMYSPWVFSLAQLVSEMPNSLLCSVGFFLLLTYPAGFYTESSRAGYQFLIILVTEIFSVTLGQAVAALCTCSFVFNYALRVRADIHHFMQRPISSLLRCSILSFCSSSPCSAVLRSRNVSKSCFAVMPHD